MPHTPHVVVINPSSSAEITAGIQASLDESAHRWGVTATAVTSYGGPRGLDSDAETHAAIGPLLATAGQHRADAYVIGCFSDLGLDELRAAAPVPVIGLAEAALISAMAHSRRIGVVSTLPMATFRHELYWARLGVSGRVVADVAIGRGSLDLASRDAANDVLSAARELVSRRGAEAVILGDPGLGHLRAPLADEIGVPVIEPCAAAVVMAVQALSNTPRPRAPEPQYRAPEPQYRAPEPSYRAPEPSYQALEPSYRAPEPQYDPRYGQQYDQSYQQQYGERPGSAYQPRFSR